MTSCLLMIGDCAAIETAVRGALVQIGQGELGLEHADRLADAIERLSKPGVDAILAHMTLPDCEGMTTFETIHRAAPDIPILILAASGDEDLARAVLDNGGQDYLLTDSHLDSYTLARALGGAISRKGAEDALFIEKERAQVTLASIGDAVLTTNVTGNVTYLNAVAEKLTGWLNADAAGRAITAVFNVVDPVTRQPIPSVTRKAVRERRTVGLPPDTILIRQDGVEIPIEDSAAPIHDRSGLVTGAVIVFRDVSVSKTLELKLSHQAQHDDLTDLPNRMQFNDRLRISIALAHRHSVPLAVLFVDLDNFKNINDSVGHAIGDLMLKEVAVRLLDSVRDFDTVSRQGGDEFVVLLSELDRAEDAVIAARKIRAALKEPYAISGHTLHITASVGISIYPNDGQDAESLVQNADVAMYHAKDNGRNNHQFFTPQMNAHAVERHVIEAGLRQALERHEFVLFYQPTVLLESGEIIGAEALIRWRHPERGLLAPAGFIGIAEETGLIAPIGQWVLREACMQARAWIDAGLTLGRMAVNMSAVEFRDPGFFDAVCTVLAETRLDPSLLELELTETVLLRNVDTTSAVLRALSAKGVRIAVDDFGTGYSSLSHLRRFPIDTLKIDRSFVQNVASDASDAAIVGAIIAMGHSLALRVVAEGVETKEQLNFLRALGCIKGQGYYFSRPVPATSFRTLLQSNRLKIGRQIRPRQRRALQPEI